MSASAADLALALELAAVGADLDRRGWVMGTSGNLSARRPGGGVLITASGRHKGRLAPEDFVRVGEPDERRRPSAEVAIHEAIYRGAPRAQAVVHVHSIATTLASRLVPESERAETLEIPGVEMIKGFDVWDAEEGGVPLLVLPNFREVPRIAGLLAEALPALRVDAFLIRGHGGTVFGRSIEEAWSRMEVLDFLCEIVLRER